MAITRTDWPRIIAQLLAKGVSIAEISAAVQVSAGAPYRWLEGSEPLHSNGQLLLALHAQHCEIHQSEDGGAHSRARKAVTTEGVDDESQSRKAG